MKTLIFCTILFYAITLPVLGDLTDADLDKIRLIVNDSEKRLKQEIKEELASIKADNRSVRYTAPKRRNRCRFTHWSHRWC